MTYDQALDAALCYGWVDGQVKRKDEVTFLQQWTPRRARSPWSKRNVGIVARLIDEGLMQPPGLAEVERAKADGRWEAAYVGPATKMVHRLSDQAPRDQGPPARDVRRHARAQETLHPQKRTLSP